MSFAELAPKYLFTILNSIIELILELPIYLLKSISKSI